jgi:hypothetical protein
VYAIFIPWDVATATWDVLRPLKVRRNACGMA